jgi:hypothetical protein
MQILQAREFGSNHTHKLAQIYWFSAQEDFAILCFCKL